MIRPDEATARAAVLGGAVLGGGGGGYIDDGLERAVLALRVGRPELWTLGEFVGAHGPDALLLTVSAVGAPAAPERFIRPLDYLAAARLAIDGAPGPVRGLITNENGGTATVNGWFQSAVLGLPVVDAPCNGRAHPTGKMGAMGLHARPGYTSLQAAVGGNPDTGRRVELVVRAPLSRAASLVRAAAVEAGGLVAVARDPQPASYVMEHGAPGAISQAIELGRRMLEAEAAGPQAVQAAVLDFLGGRLLGRGTVSAVHLETRGGFDAGHAIVTGEDGSRLELTFWNEFMTAERLAAPGQGRAEGAGHARLATFPDLIAVLAEATGLPVASAELAQDMAVAVVAAPRERLILGAGMRFPELLREAETAVGRWLLEPEHGGCGA